MERMYNVILSLFQYSIYSIYIYVFYLSKENMLKLCFKKLFLSLATVLCSSPDERFQTTSAPFPFPPQQPVLPSLPASILLFLSLSLRRGSPQPRCAPSSLPSQDLHAGALCHQCVPRPHPPHPTDLRLLPSFPRLPHHPPSTPEKTNSKGQRRGRRWERRKRLQEGERARGEQRVCRLGWRWQWVCLVASDCLHLVPFGLVYKCVYALSNHFADAFFHKSADILLERPGVKCFSQGHIGNGTWKSPCGFQTYKLCHCHCQVKSLTT